MKTKRQILAALHARLKQVNQEFGKHLKGDHAQTSCVDCNRCWGAIWTLEKTIVEFGGRVKGEGPGNVLLGG